MTNNNNLKAMIDERVQGRDIEKLFDSFIENVTDTVIDDLELAQGTDDEVNDAIDLIIEGVMDRFGYQLKQ